MRKTRYKRRNYFIKKDMQGKHMFLYFILIFAGILVFSLLLGWFSSGSMTMTYDDYALHVGATPSVLLRNFFSANLVFILLGGGVLLLFMMLMSHRIAGPIYKFERYVDDMSRGRLGQPLYLREKDEGKQLAEKLLHLSRDLAVTFEQLQDLNREIEDALAAASDSETVQQLTRSSLRMRTILEKYSLDSDA